MLIYTDRDRKAVKEALLRARRYLLDREDADTWMEDDEAAALIKQLADYGYVHWLCKKPSAHPPLV